MGRSGAPRAALAVLPAQPGVYRFRDAADRAIYLGRATDLHARVASYWGPLRDRPHLRRMVGQVHRIEALACRSGHEAAWLERTLLERAKPRWNRVRGGLEVPAWILLETPPGSARLRVAHRAEEGPHVEAFGPYLGGTRSREAAAGLHRALRLDYAGDRLGGSDRDMARVHAVRADERADRVGTARALLQRDPGAGAAVSAALVAQRDAACDALAFELAARIQAELDALAWVTAEQAVMDPRAPDATLCGWEGGPLVRLERRDGRIQRWTAQARSASLGADPRAGTPPEWAAFMAAAARLAAALAEAQASTAPNTGLAPDAAAH
jgi:excinuclease ABC subunit C